MKGWRDRVIPDRAGPLMLAGVLMCLAHPPFHLLVPSFVALVPLILWLEGQPDTEEGRRQVRIGGFFFGLVYYTLVFYWLLVTLVFYTWLALVAFLVPILVLSTFMAWTIGGIHRVRARMGWPIWLLFPVFWTANEWLRASLPQVGFPWMQFGDTLTGFPWLIGAADLVGSRGMSLWLALANALTAVVILAARQGGRHRAVRAGLALVVVLTIPIGYSLSRWLTLDIRPVARVGVVQPNVPQHIKLEDQVMSTDSAVRATETLVRPWVGRESIDLLLMPEVMIQLYLDPIPSRNFPGWGQMERWATELGESLDSDVLVGANGAIDLGEGEYTPLNSAFYYRPGVGRVTRYDKRFLVPLVERVPFLPPAWFAGIPFMGGFGVGALVPPIELETEHGPAAFGVMICYESIFSPLARHYRRNGADFLVNITNDSWFGRDVWWSRSSALSQHPAHLVMRAIETRMGIARSANTGVSEIVDPLGRVSHVTSLFEPAAFVAEVRTTDVETLYVRFGDVSGWSAAIATILALGASMWRTRATSRAGESESDAGEDE